MSERPAASYGFPILVVCGIVTTAVLALLVGRVGTSDPAPAEPARAAEAPASSAPAADAASPDAAEPAAAALRLPFGPDAASRVPSPVTPAHLTGGTNAAAVLALPGGSPATAALHWLDGGGVPTTVAESLDDALQHAVVVVLGPLPDADVPRLEAYARAGGIVVLEQPASAPLTALAGVGDPASAVHDSFIVLPGGGIDAATVRFPATDTTGWGLDAGALARYPDGKAAIAARQLDAGVVIALGVSLRGSVLASEASVVAPPAPASDEPNVGAALARDVMAHLGRTIYGLAAPGITLGGAPDGRAAALVLTHDVDTADALERAGDLAAIERDRDVSATYFVTAQATAAPGAPAVLDTASADRLQELEGLGADLQSGGVAFGERPDLPVGSGSEALPGYVPTLESGGASQFGEARVSRHVLDARVPRPGARRLPRAVRALAARPRRRPGRHRLQRGRVRARRRGGRRAAVPAGGRRRRRRRAARAAPPAALRRPHRPDARPPRGRARRDPAELRGHRRARRRPHLAAARLRRDLRAGEPAGPGAAGPVDRLRGRLRRVLVGALVRWPSTSRRTADGLARAPQRPGPGARPDAGAAVPRRARERRGGDRPPCRSPATGSASPSRRSRTRSRSRSCRPARQHPRTTAPPADAVAPTDSGAVASSNG